MSITDTNQSKNEDEYAITNSQQLYQQMAGGADWLIGLAIASKEAYLKE